VQNNEIILNLLFEKKLITDEQLNAGYEYLAEKDNKLDIISSLIKLKFIEEDEILKALAEEYCTDFISLDSFEISPDLIKEFPANIAREYHVIPLYKKDDVLIIAIPDPSDFDTIDSLRYVLQFNYEFAVASKEKIDRLIEHHYGTLTENVDSFLKTMEGEENLETSLEINEKKDESSESDDADAPIIKLVSLIIIEAFKRKASDIHLEPLEKKFRVRYRIDGVLVEVDSPPKYLQSNVISRLKIMAKMDISEKRVPQDGRIQLKTKDKSIDLRVSSVPSSHGESIVMRILDKSSIMIDISSLGFFEDDRRHINNIINMSDGIFLVTGPTGSGKTTSLYAFLNTVNNPTKKIITAEDPVEYQLEGINQVQINSSIGMTFAAALRAMMRQAPNIIMVGEIRDMETAEIAINAALTGHLVFSTLHTNDAPSAVTRLGDIGVKPFLIASALRAVMAQRLVRKICSRCAIPYTPTDYELKILRVEKENISNYTLMKGAGCPECFNSGYKGRIGLFELFMINDEIQNMIFTGATSYNLRQAAIRSGMTSLRQDGIRKVLAGRTTVEEVVRVSVADEDY